MAWCGTTRLPCTKRPHPPWPQFASERDLPFYFVSAADGTNVVKAFQDAIEAAIAYKESPVKSFYNDVVDLLADSAVPVKQSV